MKKTEVREYAYEELMDEVRAKILEDYKSIASFLRSDKYKEEFGIGQKTMANVRMYLSNGANGGKVNKSFPMLKRLYELIFCIELESRTEVIRRNIITIKQL